MSSFPSPGTAGQRPARTLSMAARSALLPLCLALPVVLLLAVATTGCAPEPESPASAGSSSAGSPGDSETGTSPVGHGIRERQPSLVDATAEWGVDFTHDAGSGGRLLFPEMMGGGVAVFDADGDADLDLYFVTGGPDLSGWPDVRPEPGGSTNRLFLQGPDGRFVDATVGSGLDDPSYGTGVAVGDYDNDGHEDVYVSNIGADRLFRNRGDGTFEDVTEAAGVDVGAWSTSAAFCDLDRDGHLDLYTVRYVVYDPAVECTDKAGRREYCGPNSFDDEPDALLLSNGDGTFRDASRQAGIDAVTGAGLGVVCEDLNDDGWMDVYVANDGDPNQLWINQGGREGGGRARGGPVTFLDDALILGTSVNASGLAEAGMGVIAADFDNDADYDLFLTHLRDETNTFYRNRGADLGFEDQSARLGLAAQSTAYTGFGTVAVDLELDGDLDLAIVNGRVIRGPALVDHLAGDWNLYAEPNLLYVNRGDEFVLAGEGVAGFVEPVEIGRGLAAGDLDGDGDLDLVATHIASPVRLYRNQARELAEGAAHWLLVDAFDPRLGRRALGARVVVEAGGQRQMRTIQGATSYLSSSDPRAHFGLGAADAIDSITVRWPDGSKETFGGPNAPLGVDRVLRLVRGEGRPQAARKATEK